MAEDKPWKSFLLFIKFGDESAPREATTDRWGFHGTIEAVERLDEALRNIDNFHVLNKMESDDGKMICYRVQCKYDPSMIADLIEFSDKFGAFRKTNKRINNVIRGGDSIIIAEVQDAVEIRNKRDKNAWIAFH